jgi:hypothetical protein
MVDMFTRRSIHLAFLLALTTGCSQFSFPWKQSASAPPAQPTYVTPSPPAPVLATPTLPADSPAPDALAQKVANYRQELEAEMNRSQPPASAATQPASPALGDSSWFTPDSIRLTPYDQDSNSTGPRVIAAVTPQAPARAAASGDANFPMSVPEGSENQTAPTESTSAPDAGGWTAEDIEHKLATRLRDDPQDMESQLDYELFLFLEGQPVPQMSALSGLRPEDREVLAAIMDGLSNFRGVLRSENNPLLAAKVRPLLDMSDRLRTQAEMTLPTVALCSDVKSYGVYTPVDHSRFIAGRDNQTIVYCEVDNFQSQLTSDNFWQTKLTEEMVLYTESGLPVWPAKNDPKPVTDLCRQRRHDFFILHMITLPQNLTIGRYLLKLTVTDQQANRVAEATTPVEIVAE